MKDEGEIDGGFVGDFFGALPEGFVAKALSLTSPRDACRLSLVASIFRAAAEWDAVWESFLPPDYRKIMAEAEKDGGGGGSLRFGSKKELYLRLCDRPLFIDGGNKMICLDKWSGKKCYMLAARDLSIVWGDTPRYWRWLSIPESRFSEVAELMSVCWLEINGEISTSMLSPNTTYVANLVFKTTDDTYGFEDDPIEVSIGLNGLEARTKTVFLEPEAGQRRRYPVVPRRRIGMFNRRFYLSNTPMPAPSKCNNGNGDGAKQRTDGWLEIELGEFVNNRGEEGVLEMSFKEVKGGNWKGGLIVQGIELRPKKCK